MMVTKYEYMFAYTFGSRKGNGSGRVFLTLNEPITTREHIEEMERFQNERNGFKCAAVNFQLIRTFEAIED